MHVEVKFNAISPKVASGDEGLDQALGGGFPEGSVILLEGKTGTGRSTLGNAFVCKSRDLDEPSLTLLTNESRKAYVSNILATLGKDCNECFLTKKHDIIEFPYATGKDTQIALAQFFSRAKELRVKRLLIDSFTPIAQLLSSPVEIRNTIRKMRDELGQAFGCTIMLIVDVLRGEGLPKEGVEEFSADGIIELDQTELLGHRIRQLNIRKLRGAHIAFHILAYSLEGGRFRTIVPFTLKPQVDVGRFQPVKDTADRFSTGIPKLDLLLEGGYPRGGVVLVELGEEVSFPQYRLVVDPVVWNFLTQKRGRTAIGGTGRSNETFLTSCRRAGLADDEINRLTTKFTYAEADSEPQFVKLEGDCQKDIKTYSAAVEKLAQATGQPILETVSVDMLSLVYEAGEVMRFLDSCVRRVREEGHLLLLILRPDGDEVRRKVKSVADIHLRVDIVHRALVLSSLRSDTWLRVVQVDMSMGYPMPRFFAN